MAKKIHIVGVSQCFPDAGRNAVFELFTDKKNRIDAVFAKKEDSSLLSWVRGQISSVKKSVVLENNGNMSHLNNAAIFYDSKVKFIIDYVRGNLGKKNILILANGDPNFFGIGASLLNELKENEKRFIEIYPALSFMQIGFAKLKIPMTEALIVSLHGRDLENIYESVRAQKQAVGIYTDYANTPYKIYEELKEKGFLDDYDFFALTDLCSKNEKIYKSFTKEILDDIGGKKNIVVLNKKIKNTKTEDKKQARPAYFVSDADDECNAASNPAYKVIGIDDDKFIHAAGEPTKKEIRSVSIGLMDLMPDSAVVDAGCGSGGISIEVSGIAYKGLVYAIDKNAVKIENLKKNIKKFGRANIEPVLGELPEAFKNIGRDGQIDSVFIGGGGGRLDIILEGAFNILKDNGAIVVNCITINSLNKVLSFIGNFKPKGDGGSPIKYELISVNVSRLKSLNDKEDSYFHALNQIYIAKIIKPAKSSVPAPPAAKNARAHNAHMHKHIHKPPQIFNIDVQTEENKPKVRVRNKAIKAGNSEKIKTEAGETGQNGQNGENGQND